MSLLNKSFEVLDSLYNRKSQAIVIGGKGTAINVAESLLDASKNYDDSIELLGFAIDDTSLGKEISGIPVISGTKRLSECWPQRDVKFVFCLFKPERMRERTKLLASYGIDLTRFLTFIHPLAYIAPSARLGYGTVILAGTSVQHGVFIHNNCIINSNVVIEHDSVVGDCNFIAAASCIGASVEIGKGVFVGLNATIRENCKIDDYSFIGMGSVVTRDVAKGMTVFGVPARVR